MHRIKNLNLKNFKFFYGLEAIPFDRKNILLYGENGSGKSSIYWALYTFLQSALKDDPDDVRKYFMPISRHQESIKNRYADEGDESYIEIEFEDESQDLRKKVISNTTVNTKSDDFVETITLSSDLIDYKSIFNIYNFTNKDRVKLFSYIEKNLMPFINLRTTLTTVEGDEKSNNLNDWWQYLKPGLDPYPNIGGPGYWEFQALIDQFNSDFEFYLNSITEKANDYLQNRFKETLKIKFEYENCSYNDPNGKGRTRTTKPPEIYLKAEILNPNLKDELKEVNRVHTFLNEARLSSIALAIRMAMLKEKLIQSAPKVLILDDLLLSLDMGNRESVLNIILEEYSQDYQIIFLTHDRIFFQSVLSYIKTYHSNQLRIAGVTDKTRLDSAYHESWKIFEMYESNLLDGKTVPEITEYKSKTQKAYHYFNNKGHIDYQACGNNLRTALEEFFREFLPSKFLRKENGAEPMENTSLTLNTLLVRATNYFNHLGFSTLLLDRLNRYRERALNQASHYNPTSNYFKRELQDTFEILKELRRYRNEIIIPNDEILNFTITSRSGNDYNYKFKPLSEIRLNLEPGSGKTSFYCDDDKFTFALVEFTSPNGTVELDKLTNRRTFQEFYDETITGLEAHIKEVCVRSTEIYDTIKNEAGRSLIELKTY